MKYLTSKKTKRMTLLVSFFVLISVSCKKFITIDPPKTQLVAATVFQSEGTANAAVSQLYLNSLTYTSGTMYSPSIIGIRISDEADNYSSNLELTQLANNLTLSSNTYATTLWSSLYTNIYLANTLLEGLEGNEKISAVARNRMMGEAHFFRAYAHLYLTILYGDVPIITTTNYKENNVANQQTSAKVLDFVAAELIRAASLLPVDFITSANERIKATKWAAISLLARTYLYAGKYEQAIEQCNLVIANANLFSLVTLNDVFLKNNKEAILQLKPTSTNFNTNEGNLLVLTAKPAQIALKPSFYNSFELGDQRKVNWIGTLNVAGVSYYYPLKYKVKTATVLSEYSVALRLAEIFLISAECHARLNQIPAAIEALDKVRLRAGLASIAITNPSISQDDLLTLVLKERRSELFTEWAHRWIDLRRFGKLDETMSAIKPGWTSTSNLFPKPYNEVLINRNLIQNPGY